MGKKKISPFTEAEPLENEREKYKGKSIAVDIDSTLFVGKYRYPDVGEPNYLLIKALNTFRKRGGVVIINTLREKTSPLGDVLTPALNYLYQNRLRWDYVNENIPSEIRKYDDDPRKIAATYYLDDRNIDMLQLIKMVYGDDSK